MVFLHWGRTYIRLLSIGEMIRRTFYSVIYAIVVSIVVLFIAGKAPVVSRLFIAFLGCFIIDNSYDFDSKKGVCRGIVQDAFCSVVGSDDDRRLYGQGCKNYSSDRSTKHPDPGPENGQTAALHAY